MTRITGWHVFGIFALGFGTIIAVNLTLAFNAVRTFPGLEVGNSYVASQSFDRERVAQEKLNWQVEARVKENNLILTFERSGAAVAPTIESAVFGRATSVAADQMPDFKYNGTAFVAPIEAGPGNWNLRIKARAADGTLFQQRVIVEVAE